MFSIQNLKKLADCELFSSYEFLIIFGKTITISSTHLNHGNKPKTNFSLRALLLTLTTDYSAVRAGVFPPELDREDQSGAGQLRLQLAADTHCGGPQQAPGPDLHVPVWGDRGESHVAGTLKRMEEVPSQWGVATLISRLLLIFHD